MSPALSIANLASNSIKTRRVAILVADGVDQTDVGFMIKALAARGAMCDVSAQKLGSVSGEDGVSIAVDCSAITGDSMMYDAVYIPGGKSSADALAISPKALLFVVEAFGHAKPVAAIGAGVTVLGAANLPATIADEHSGGIVNDLGVVTTVNSIDGGFAEAVLTAIAGYRYFDRPQASS